MPSQVRIISKRNSAQWDDLVADVVGKRAWSTEHTYGGISSNERADQVRRAIVTAARRKNVGKKVFWYACADKPRCKFGSDCQYHVSYTIYPIEDARAYRAQQSKSRRR